MYRNGCAQRTSHTPSSGCSTNGAARRQPACQQGGLCWDDNSTLWPHSETFPTSRAPFWSCAIILGRQFEYLSVSLFLLLLLFFLFIYCLFLFIFWLFGYNVFCFCCLHIAVLCFLRKKSKKKWLLLSTLFTCWH